MPLPETHVSLPVGQPPWERVFMPAPLVIVGTREPDGGHDLAPKHMAFPLSWQAWFGFVCAPTHRTWDNAVRTGTFTVSYLGPDQVLQATLAAGPREHDASKPTLAAVPVIDAQVVDGVLVRGCPLYLECELDRVVAGLGDNGLLVGRVVAMHVHRDVLRTSDRDDADLLQAHPLLVYVHPDRFARIERTDQLPLHVGFKR